MFGIFGLKRVGLKYDPFFLCFFGRPERSKGWANMQSVHAGAVQTHFSIFTLSLKSRSQITSCWVPFWRQFSSKIEFLLKKGHQKRGSKKGAPPDSNNTL